MCECKRSGLPEKLIDCYERLYYIIMAHNRVEERWQNVQVL